MSKKAEDRQLRDAKGWSWWLRYCAAWRLPRWLSRVVQPRIFSDEALQRALSSDVKPLFRLPTIH
jgi:hypothetical protein